MGNMTKSGSSRTWEDTTKQISPGMAANNFCIHCKSFKTSKKHLKNRDDCARKNYNLFVAKNNQEVAA
jgi:hypothetical protein